MSDQAQLPFSEIPATDTADGAAAPLPPARKVWGVAELLSELRQSIERGFFSVWIEGEISNFHRAASRHCYFTLKDGQAQIRVALFAQQARYMRVPLRDGLQVLVRGRVSVYEPRGELQCQVEHVEPLGRGELQLAFEKLKEKLTAEGLFRPERKKPLPRLPRRIGVITSPRGAAVADIVQTLQRRFRRLDILLYPVPVQGEAAAGEMCRALEFFAEQEADSRFRPDLVILARGGGSLEDLWPFNDETLARRLAAMPMPVISGVGHETDFTIADFVADLRAPTPTGAAELAIRPESEFVREWSAAARHLEQAARYRLLRERRRVDELSQHRAFNILERRLRQRTQRIDELSSALESGWQGRQQRSRRQLELAAARIRQQDPRVRLRAAQGAAAIRARALLTAWQADLTRRRHRLASLAAVLEERNPLRILQRGYTLVYDRNARLITKPGGVNEGEALRIRFAQGWLEAEARTGRKPVS